MPRLLLPITDEEENLLVDQLPLFSNKIREQEKELTHIYSKWQEHTDILAQNKGNDKLLKYYFKSIATEHPTDINLGIFNDPEDNQSPVNLIIQNCEAVDDLFINPMILLQSHGLVHRMYNAFSDNPEDIGGVSNEISALKNINQRYFSGLSVAAKSFAFAMAPILEKNGVDDEKQKALIENLTKAIERDIAIKVLGNLKLKLEENVDKLNQSELSPLDKAINTLIACRYVEERQKTFSHMMTKEEYLYLQSEMKKFKRNPIITYLNEIDSLKKSLADKFEKGLQNINGVGELRMDITIAEVGKSLYKLLEFSAFAEPEAKQKFEELATALLDQIDKKIIETLERISTNTENVNPEDINYVNELYLLRLETEKGCLLSPDYIFRKRTNLFNAFEVSSKKIKNNSELAKKIKVVSDNVDTIAFKVVRHLTVASQMQQETPAVNEFLNENKALREEGVRPWVSAVEACITKIQETNDINKCKDEFEALTKEEVKITDIQGGLPRKGKHLQLASQSLPNSMLAGLENLLAKHTDTMRKSLSNVDINTAPTLITIYRFLFKFNDIVEASGPEEQIKYREKLAEAKIAATALTTAVCNKMSIAIKNAIQEALAPRTKESFNQNLQLMRELSLKLATLEKDAKLSETLDDNTQQAIDSIKKEVANAITTIEQQVTDKIDKDYGQSTVGVFLKDVIIYSATFKETLEKLILIQSAKDKQAVGGNFIITTDRISQKFETSFAQLINNKKLASYEQVEDLLLALDALVSNKVFNPNQTEQLIEKISKVLIGSKTNRFEIMSHINRFETENPNSGLKFKRLQDYRDAIFGTSETITLLSLAKINNNEDAKKMLLSLFNKSGLGAINLKITAGDATAEQIEILTKYIKLAMDRNSLLVITISYPKSAAESFGKLNLMLNEKNAARQSAMIKIDEQFDAASTIDDFSQKVQIKGLNEEDLKKMYVNLLFAKNLHLDPVQFTARFNNDGEKLFKEVSFLSTKSEREHVFFQMAIYYQEKNPKLSIKFLSLIPVDSEAHPKALSEMIRISASNKDLSNDMYSAALILLANDLFFASEDSEARTQIVITNVITQLPLIEDKDQALRFFMLIVGALDKRQEKKFGNDNIELLKASINNYIQPPLTDNHIKLIEQILSSDNIENTASLLNETLLKAYADQIIITSHNETLVKRQIELLVQYDKPTPAISEALKTLSSTFNIKLTPVLIDMMNQMTSITTNFTSNQTSLILHLLSNYSHELRMEMGNDNFIKTTAALSTQLLNQNNPEASLKIIEFALIALPVEYKQSSLGNSAYLKIKPLRDAFKPFDIASEKPVHTEFTNYLKSLASDVFATPTAAARHEKYKQLAQMIHTSGVVNLTERVNSIKKSVNNMASGSDKKIAAAAASTAGQALFLLGIPELPRTFRSDSNSSSSSSTGDIVQNPLEVSQSAREFMVNFSKSIVELLPNIKSKPTNIRMRKQGADDQLVTFQDAREAREQLKTLREKIAALKSIINAGRGSPSLIAGVEKVLSSAINASKVGDIIPPTDRSESDNAAILEMINVLETQLMAKEMEVEGAQGVDVLGKFVGYFIHKEQEARTDYERADTMSSPKKREEAIADKHHNDIKATSLIEVLKNLEQVMLHPDDLLVEATFRASFTQWQKTPMDSKSSKRTWIGQQFQKTLAKAEHVFYQERLSADSLIYLAKNSPEQVTKFKESLETFTKIDITKTKPAIDVLQEAYNNLKTYIAKTTTDLGKKASNMAESFWARLTGGDTAVKGAKDRAKDRKEGMT